MGKNSHQQFLLAQKQQKQVIAETTKETGIPKAVLKILAGPLHPQQVSHVNQLNLQKMKG
jgi:hypothetical protein